MLGTPSSRLATSKNRSSVATQQNRSKRDEWWCSDARAAITHTLLACASHQRLQTHNTPLALPKAQAALQKIKITATHHADRNTG